MPILVSLILLSGAVATGQLLPPPGDGEIRAVYWELRNESEVWLTLELRNANGDRAPLLTLTRHFSGRQPAAPPAHIEVRAFAGMFWAPRAELWLMIDDQERIDLASQGRSFGLVSGTPSDYLSEQVTIATLKRVAAAGRVTGNALGFDFELTRPQRAAIAAFLERVLGTPPCAGCEPQGSVRHGTAHRAKGCEATTRAPKVAAGADVSRICEEKANKTGAPNLAE